MRLSFWKKGKEKNKHKVCSHSLTRTFFDLASEKVVTQCVDCGVILGFFNPHETKTSTKNNWLLRDALKK